MTPGPDGLLPTVAAPDDVCLVTAGGAGAGWSLHAAWAPRQHARATTRRVRPPGEALPDCGPDGARSTFRPSRRSHDTITVLTPVDEDAAPVPEGVPAARAARSRSACGSR